MKRPLSPTVLSAIRAVAAIPVLYFAALGDGSSVDIALAMAAAAAAAMWLIDWLLSAFWYPRQEYLIVAAALGSALGQQAVANLLIPQISGDGSGNYLFGVFVSYFAVSLLSFAIRGWWRTTYGKRSPLDV